MTLIVGFLRKHWPETVVGLLLFGYVVARAALVSMTIDESQTCIVYARMPFADIVSYADPIPNNHILNTLLIKWFSFVFGMNQFVVRLPNVLGFAVYFVSVAATMRLLYPTSLALRLAGVALLVCNPYFMDFFGLGRGYALSCAFVALAVWQALLYQRTFLTMPLLVSIVAAAFAVYTSFTALNFYAAFVGLLFLLPWIYRRRSREKLQNALTLFGVSGVLAAISFLPITRMVSTGQFVFWGSTGFYPNTVAAW